MSENKKEGKKPIFKLRAGNVSASVFENKAKKGDDEFTYESIVLQRSYKKDENSDWVNESINLRKADLIKLKVVVDELSQKLFLNKDDSE